MEALAPIAEEHGVTLALEVHADQYASHPRILALRDRYEKVGSPFLGFTMDWGATVSGFAPSLHRGLPSPRRVGGTARAGRRPVEHATTSRVRPRDQAEHGQRFGSFIGLAAQQRPSRPRHRLRHQRHRPVRPGAGGRLARDHAVDQHVHGKFFGIDENGEEPSVPVRDLVRLLVENGYNGAISSEYEGWHWNNWQSRRSTSSAASRPCSAPPPPTPARA